MLRKRVPDKAFKGFGNVENLRKSVDISERHENAAE